MKTSYFFILVLIVIAFAGCGANNSSTGSTQDSSQESSQDSSQDSSHDASSGHYQGESCARCHSTSSGESEHVFTSGATIFGALDATNSTAKAANNYSLRLLLAQSAQKISYGNGRGSGNVHATFSTGGIAKYTAQVLDAQGNVVNSSLTDSHDALRFDCNRCHTSTGKNGAPGRIVSFKYVASTSGGQSGSTTGGTTGTTTILAKSFTNDVKPILTRKCAGCHGYSGRFSITRNTPYAGTMQFVNTTTPASSRLLQKGSGSISHGGGSIFTSTDVTTIRDWISQGAKNN